MTSPDLSRESRWAGYPQRAMMFGMSAVYSSPILVRDQALGVLNLYSDTTGAFDGQECADTIASIVSLAAVAVTGALRNYGDITLTDQLQQALSSRSAIDQAIGIILATQHCTPQQAFDVLRTASQTRNTRLAQIAQELVDRTISQ